MAATTLRIHGAMRVPGGSRRRTRVVVTCGTATASTAFKVGVSPQYEEELSLCTVAAKGEERNNAPLSGSVRFELVSGRSSVIGQVTTTMSQLRGTHERPLLLLLHGSGTKKDAIVAGRPRQPCFVRVSLVLDPTATTPVVPFTPPPLPPPPALETTAGAAAATAPSYSRHVLMLNRGTRGDLQPLLTLAIGMAEQLGWLVTICAEQRFGEWVEEKARGVQRGRVQFVASGGDTESRMRWWVASSVLFQLHTELAQWLMAGMAEQDFEGSVPVFVDQLARLQASEAPVDYLVCGFTVVAACMLLSEKFGLPMVPLIMQPRCIPSHFHRVIEPIHSRLAAWTLSSQLSAPSRPTAPSAR